MARNTDASAGRRGLHDPAGTAVAVLFIALGVLLITQTGRMTPMGSVFPITISVAMIVLSAVLVLRNVIIGFRGTEAAKEDDGAAERGSMARRILFLVVMAAWVALIPFLGFFVASLLAFFAIMAIATHERVTMRELAILTAVGVAILLAFYLLMANVLLIPMPRGLFF
ncbi:tripartite tricarboxylate transporter TctB family protein [Aurantimonas sp. VKM B-3413]|uniref:tripartite tricarboxylate transporter TctB family protein n=1 Tax=Aurantimonas sp. VKM B-3413 TaxID=2779401 RepID=UPI001E609347|nr:tripartite tricarboxylate transporter TctB family protein [Aurantimonas sp. VKM B-3413]MCB8838155.1 tripartite tricarboxylate transporter TctB family protein [Aurantimonas sp. VKM B-3413]